MADNNAVGGVQATGGRFGSPRHTPERQGQPARGQAAQERAGDAVQLSDGLHAACPLLRERVLAATRRLLCSSLQPSPPAPVVAPEARTPKAASPRDSLSVADSPAAAAAAIVQQQRRLCGARLQEAGIGELLRAAFAAGLADARGILREVGRLDAGVEAWFAAVVAAQLAMPPAALPTT
jgi:hypothetical protein